MCRKVLQEFFWNSNTFATRSILNFQRILLGEATGFINAGSISSALWAPPPHNILAAFFTPDQVILFFSFSITHGHLIERVRIGFPAGAQLTP